MLDGTCPKDQVEAHCRAFEEKINRYGIDILILGINGDGAIGSDPRLLFPSLPISFLLFFIAILPRHYKLPPCSFHLPSHERRRFPSQDRHPLRSHGPQAPQRGTFPYLPFLPIQTH